MKKNTINKKTGFYDSKDGVSKIAYYIYSPKSKELKGIIQISHGMQEYIERYEDFINYYCNAGYVVCGNDHLGHGKTSESGEKIKGFMGERNGYLYVTSDLFSMTEIIKKEYPNLPLFMFGHSMGSFYARYYVEFYGKELKGLIISGTGGPNPISGIGLALVKAAVKAKGVRSTSKFFDGLLFGKYNKKIENLKTAVDWITRNEDVLKKYEDDPYCAFRFTLGGYRDLITIQSIVNKKDWALNVPKSLPLFLVSGTEDPVGNYGKGVEKVYRMLKNSGHEDVTIKLYEGCRHEVHNEIEPVRHEFYQDVEKWMNDRLR